MSVFNKVFDALAALKRAGDKADYVTLNKADMDELRGDPMLTHTMPGAVPRIAEVRLMEGEPFDHSFIQAHHPDRTPFRVLLS